VKCNYDPVLLQTLAALGTGFDCASKQEIVTILNLGVDPSRIIYANPCKQNSHIRLGIRVNGIGKKFLKIRINFVVHNSETKTCSIGLAHYV